MIIYFDELNYLGYNLNWLSLKVYLRSKSMAIIFIDFLIFLKIFGKFRADLDLNEITEMFRLFIKSLVL